MSGDRLLPVERVILAKWDFGPKGTEYCVEFLDTAAEVAGEDAHFPTEAEAERHALYEFGLPDAEWRDGPPPLPHEARAVASAQVPNYYELDRIDRDIIRMALCGDVDMRRYVPEVMRLCARLRITEPPWLEEDPAIAERVALNRPEWPRRDYSDPE